MSYHWLLDLFSHLNLPILDAKNLARKGSEVAKKQRSHWKQARVAEHEDRKKWSRSQKLQHTYGSDSDEENEEPVGGDPKAGSAVVISKPGQCRRKKATVPDPSTSAHRCTCGSSKHKNVSHRNCPLNKRAITMAPTSHSQKGRQVVPSTPSCSDTDSSSSTSSSSTSSSSSGEGEGCTCGGERTHSRSCPLNPRYAGKRIGSVSGPVPAHRSRSSVGLDSEGEGIVKYKGPEDYEITSAGTPTPRWRGDAITFLGSLTNVPLVQELERLRPIQCLEIAPHIRDAIVGDGNCIRAISKAVTGSQDNHLALRLAMVQFMLHDKHVLFLARHLDVKVHSSGPDVHERTKCAVKQCIEEKKIDKEGTWGSDKEIQIIATMFQLDILVFSKHPTGRRFVCFHPVFVTSCCMPSDGIRIFLYHNRSGDHYDCG